MTEYDEIKVHPSHQAVGHPDRLYVPKKDITPHPSAEVETGKPRYKIGDTVLWLGKPREVVDVRNIGTREIPIFEYRLQLEDEISNFLRTSDLKPVSK